MQPWQPLVIEYLFTYIMGGYLHIKFEVLSIGQFRVMAREQKKIISIF